MGIQLGQSVSIVDRSLRQKGFLRENNHGSQRMYIYSGEFWKYKNVSISCILEDGIVHSISVSPEKDNPLSGFPTNRFSKEDFNILIKNLIKKYGKYSTKKGLDYIWELEGGEISASYYREAIYIDYSDRTSPDYIRKHQKRNKNNDL
jgi:hypothetical protein